MEEIDSSPVSPNPLKREAPSDETSPEKKPLNLKGSQFVMPTPPDTDQSSNASPSRTHDGATRDVSPAPSHSTLTSIDTASPIPDRSMDIDSRGDGSANQVNAGTNSMSGQPPAKRRKLTPAEKEERQKEREAKVAERAEQRAKREEEKRLKEEERQRKAGEREEEKRLKDEERQKKADEREEEKRVKDEEKQKKADAKEAKRREKEAEEERKAEEKLKKERSQMRLGAFFQLPTETQTPNKSTGGQANGSARRKSLSLEPFDEAAERMRASQSPCKRSLQKAAFAAKSDYYDVFKPFHLPSYTSLPTAFAPRGEEVEVLQEAFDDSMHNPSATCQDANLHQQFASERSQRGIVQPGLRRLIDQIQGSQSEPIDLTQESISANPWAALHDISRRHIQFQEDVRPAYFGTYTKILSPRSCAKMRRNPFTRGREDTDYDYDSEAEWQEEEEGEDIMGEEDDEAESVAEVGEMDEFLDDEDDSLKGKRKMITGDLVPTSTGICWESERGKIISSIETDDQPREMQGMSLTFLLPGFSGKTIDPFSTEYWPSNEAATSTAQAPATTAPIRESPFTPAPSGVMAPPRPPLGPRPNSHTWPENTGLIGAAEGMKGPITSATGQPKAKPGPKPAAKMLSEEDLEEFKEAVVGSPLSKADLLKGLKSRFPKITNETIKASLGEHFAQLGASKAEKKWVFVPKN